MKKDLKKIAAEVRRDILTMSYYAKSAHTGGALSCVEILVSLYFEIMKVFPKNPEHEERDRLIFSKAHDAKALYAVLAACGFFPRSVLSGYEQNNGQLPGHSTRHCAPGVEASAGSLGHGLPIAAGSAYTGKIEGKKYRVFAILSDGECQEGSTWEAILFAGFHKLDNLIVTVDYNKLQGFGRIKDILELEPFVQKWKDFGWAVCEVNGHDFGELRRVYNKVPFEKGKPSLVLAHTVKGLGGVPKHVDQISAQYKPPTKEEAEKAIRKLGFTLHLK